MVATCTLQKYLVNGLRPLMVMDEREAEMLCVMVGRTDEVSITV